VLGGSDHGNSKVNNSNLAFQAPLGTKHAFQGWADEFLNTPTDGIEDAYLDATTPRLSKHTASSYTQARTRLHAQKLSMCQR
jgi:hypothetical protein